MTDPLQAAFVCCILRTVVVSCKVTIIVGDYYLLNIVFISSNLCLVNAKDVLDRPESMELAFFQNLMMRHIELAKDTLLKK